MKNLGLALEWAEWSKAVDQEHPHTPATAAAEVILSLPDQWVDVKKLKAIIADMDHCLKMESTTDFSKGIDNATTSWRDALKALITPKPPTLPRPEDVPAREPWIVRYEREEWVGVRANEEGLSWTLVSMDGLNFRDVSDHFVALVSRLVPEVE